MMQWASEISPDNVNYVGLTICNTGENQRHAGILYKLNKDSPWKVVHLAWHHCLKNDRLAPYSFLWGQFPSDEINLNFLAGACGECAKLKNQIPFGFSLKGISFDPDTWEIQISEEASGLTCATFVLKFFENLGYDLLDLESWQHRDDDEEWRQSILAHFEAEVRGGNIRYQKHIDKLKNNTDFRCRPEEVVVAGCKENIPLDFETAERLGLEIVAQLVGPPEPREETKEK